MGFDLDYLLVECDHWVTDDVVQSAVNPSTLLAEENAYFGEAVFGEDRLGEAIYINNNSKFGLTGTYYENPDGTITAIVPLNYTAANDLRLFYQPPGGYFRVEYPKITYEKVTAVLYYNGATYFGDGSFYGGAGMTQSSVPVELYRVVYGNPDVTYTVTINNKTYQVTGNSLIIERYLNLLTWIADYKVTSAKCPKCFGTNINNDIYINSIGKLGLVFAEEKLIQQVSKAVLTDRGHNPYFPTYGTSIQQLIGDVSQNFFVIQAEIMDQLQRIKADQTQIMLFNRNFFEAGEILDDVLTIGIKPSDDPRAIELSVVLRTNAASQVSTKKLLIRR